MVPEEEIYFVKKAWSFSERYDRYNIITGAKSEDMSFLSYVIMLLIREDALEEDTAESVAHYVIEHYGL